MIATLLWIALSTGSFLTLTWSWCNEIRVATVQWKLLDKVSEIQIGDAIDFAWCKYKAKNYTIEDKGYNKKKLSYRKGNLWITWDIGDNYQYLLELNNIGKKRKLTVR